MKKANFHVCGRYKPTPLPLSLHNTESVKPRKMVLPRKTLSEKNVILANTTNIGKKTEKMPYKKCIQITHFLKKTDKENKARVNHNVGKPSIPLAKGKLSGTLTSTNVGDHRECKKIMRSFNIVKASLSQKIIEEQVNPRKQTCRYWSLLQIHD